MRLRLICVGKVKEAYLKQGISDLEKRLTRHQRFELLELKDSDPVKEGKEILSKADGWTMFSFTPEGKEMSSEQFSDFFAGLVDDVVFVIGGPEGISDEVKENSKMLVSLSQMTFTHEMARLFLIEQVYRAVTMKKGIPYHR